jgi:ketosteroid isomerase-like protein
MIMPKAMNLKEEVKATMAEFSAAFQRGQHERLAALLAPEARLYVTDAKGTREIIGAAAASRSFDGLKGFGLAGLESDKALVLQEGNAAYVDAKLERFAEAGTTHQAGQAHEAHTHAAETQAAGMLSAELERHGEQWRVKQMHYRAE